MVIKEIERNNGDYYVVTIDRRAERHASGAGEIDVTRRVIFLAGIFSRRGGVAAPWNEERRENERRKLSSDRGRGGA